MPKTEAKFEEKKQKTRSQNYKKKINKYQENLKQKKNLEKKAKEETSSNESKDKNGLSIINSLVLGDILQRTLVREEMDLMEERRKGRPSQTGSVNEEVETGYENGIGKGEEAIYIIKVEGGTKEQSLEGLDKAMEILKQFKCSTNKQKTNHAEVTLSDADDSPELSLTQEAFLSNTEEDDDNLKTD